MKLLALALMKFEVSVAWDNKLEDALFWVTVTSRWFNKFNKMHKYRQMLENFGTDLARKRLVEFNNLKSDPAGSI